LPLTCTYLFGEQLPKGGTVAPMLGKIGLRPFVFGVGTGRVTKCLGCPVEDCGYQKPKKTWRQREKRVTQKWLDEYEDRPEDEAGACPKGGLACTCIKLPDECPHLDWDYWDNDFRRLAIGELFAVEPRWTLDSLLAVS